MRYAYGTVSRGWCRSVVVPGWHSSYGTVLMSGTIGWSSEILLEDSIMRYVVIVRYEVQVLRHLLLSKGRKCRPVSFLSPSEGSSSSSSCSLSCPTRSLANALLQWASRDCLSRRALLNGKGSRLSEGACWAWGRCHCSRRSREVATLLIKHAYDHA